MLSLKELFDFCIIDNHIDLNKNLHSINDINEKDIETGWSLLSVAVFNHSLNCVNLLLSKGANINIVNNNGTSILMYAKTKVFSNRNFSFLEYLINNGADLFIKDKFGKNVLDYVKEKNDLIMADFFINKMSEASLS